MIEVIQSSLASFMSLLRVQLVQSRLHWRDPEQNRAHLSSLIASLVTTGDDHADLIVLPETFTTGFLGDPGNETESMQGQTVGWLTELARQHQAAIMGSAVIEDHAGRHNRMLLVNRQGVVGCYDKKHLFAYGGEDQRYQPGTQREIFALNQWRICPQICYDLRFPVWCRYRGDYDMLIFVANWPTPRADAWTTLLKARAMENQCYVIGVNRVGEDGNGHHYPGLSAIYDPLGRPMLELGDNESVAVAELDLEQVKKTRKQFPFQADRDEFDLR